MKKDISSGLTLKKLIEVRSLLQDLEDQQHLDRLRNGFYSFGCFYWPRSKKKRIRKKWMRSGRAYGVRWTPPNPDAAQDLHLKLGS